MKFRAVLFAATTAAGFLAGCETATYGAGGVIGAAPSSAGFFAGAVDLRALTTATAPVARFETAAATAAAGAFSVAEQETKAAALFTGRLFLSSGKVLSPPGAETPRALVEETLPAGWRRTDNRLVHIESGLECPLEFDFRADASGGVLSLSDVAAYDRENRDVSCNYTNGGAAAVTVYAAFYPEISVEEHAAAAVAAMRQSFTLKGVLPVITVEIEDKDAGSSTADLEAPVAGAFDIGDINGAPYKTSLWIAKAGGWHVKTRATYAQTDATTELVAAVIFAANYLNVDMKNKNAPTPRGPEV